jgi:predicted MFS family arabinose efflux permease
MNTAAGVGGATAGLVVAGAGYGWLNMVAACLLVPLAALVLFTRGDGKRGPAGAGRA